MRIRQKIVEDPDNDGDIRSIKRQQIVRDAHVRNEIERGRNCFTAV